MSSVRRVSARPEKNGWKTPSLPSADHFRTWRKQWGRGFLGGSGVWHICLHFLTSVSRESENRGEETDRLRETETQKTRDKDSEADKRTGRPSKQGALNPMQPGGP